jgi:hypothetical protein
MKHLALAFALVAAAAGTASAQSRKAADRVHDFHTMDRQSPMTTFGISVGYEAWDSDPALSLGDAINAIVSVDVAGQYVTESGAGGYLTIPLSYVSSDDYGFPPFVVEGDSEVAVGNVELGGLFAGRLGKNADMVFHGGIALPTADDDGVGGALGPLAAGTRYSDLVDRVPNSTWLRAGFSPMGRANIFFWRADLGVDLMIDDQDGDAVDISPVIRVDVAAGVDIGQADFTAELVTNITNPENDMADETASTLALGARFAAGNTTQPGFCLILPVGFDDYDQFDFAVVASVTVRVP